VSLGPTAEGILIVTAITLIVGPLNLTNAICPYVQSAPMCSVPGL